jgi:Phage integrase family
MMLERRSSGGNGMNSAGIPADSGRSFQRRGARFWETRVWQAAIFLQRKSADPFSLLCKDINLKGVTFHTIRHTFSTRLAEANVNPFTARDLMGHEEVNMIGYYTHTAIETMREAVTRLERASNQSDFAANVSQTSGEKNVEHAK